jgi:hypothetical protein
MIPAYKETVNVAPTAPANNLSVEQHLRFLEEQVRELQSRVEYFERENIRMKSSIQQISEHLSRGK